MEGHQEGLSVVLVLVQHSWIFSFLKNRSYLILLSNLICITRAWYLCSWHFFLLRRIYCKTRPTRAGRMRRAVNKRGINAKNGAYKKRLPLFQRRGLSTLLPKKNKPGNLLKNWRPITLLNCDYKIAAISIANRITKFLPNLINND